MWGERDDDHLEVVRNYIRCKDGFCGADDCPTCRPGNFTGGVWNEDIETGNRAQDGRTCNCEDAPCCGCYNL